MNLLPEPGQPIREEHLLNGMKLLAYIISKPDGEFYTPLFETLEAELTKLRRARATVDRAKQFLELYTVEGGLRAIR